MNAYRKRGLSKTDLYSDEKGSDLAVGNSIRVDLEGIMLNEFRQTEKGKYHTISQVASKTPNS